jgi:hypothetical protein
MTSFKSHQSKGKKFYSAISRPSKTRVVEKLNNDQKKCAEVGTIGICVYACVHSILLHDLPNYLAANTHVVQYADDIAIWINTNIKKRSGKKNNQSCSEFILKRT